MLAISWSLDKPDWCVFQQIQQICFDNAGFVSINYCWRKCDHSWRRQNTRTTYQQLIIVKRTVRWEKRSSIHHISERPQTFLQALKQCDRDAYPNLSVLLRIAGTVAVTSCECERPRSVSKTLKYLSKRINETRKIKRTCVDAHQL